MGPPRGVLAVRAPPLLTDWLSVSNTRSSLKYFLCEFISSYISLFYSLFILEAFTDNVERIFFVRYTEALMDICSAFPGPARRPLGVCWQSKTIRPYLSAKVHSFLPVISWEQTLASKNTASTNNKIAKSMSNEHSKLFKERSLDRAMPRLVEVWVSWHPPAWCVLGELIWNVMRSEGRFHVVIWCSTAIKIWNEQRQLWRRTHVRVPLPLAFPSTKREESAAIKDEWL